MDQTKRTPTTVLRRAPLTERQPQAKPSSTLSKTSQQQKSSCSPPIPHHESVYPEGNLSVIARPSAPSPRAANNRVIAIAQDDADSHKRDSQISTASTISTTKSKRKTHIGPWQLGKTLGKGATGRVRLAKHSLTGQSAAVKIVSKRSAAMVQSASMAQMDNDTSLPENMAGNRTMPFGIEREIVIMKLIDHPNITCLYDIWENHGELYLVMEYVEGGELFEYVMRNRTLPEAEAVRLFRQLIAGLAYCHRFNICHRDLKPENLLLDRDHNLKIADFGMAALQPNGKNLTTSCGSPHYAAPEIIAARAYKGSQADVWSVGIILYAMLNGFLPFDGEDLSSTLRLVRRGRYYLSPNLSPEATDLLQRILQLDPEQRITIDQMWSHPLLRKYESLHRSLAPDGQFAGPPPALSVADCGPSRLRASEIDRELLRNLQVLWHGLEEQEVIKRLTSSEPNHEKLFYQALLKFRDEQLENFTGDPLQYSASDYHHIRKPAPRLTKSLTKSTLHQRRTSQFSIVSGDSIVRDAYYKNPKTATSKTTQGSYDPYRASRTPITQTQKQGTRVVVDRPGSYPSARLASSSSLRYGPHGRMPTSTPDVPSLGSRELQKFLEQKRSTYSTVSSHSSLASSQRKRVFRKSTSYRRTVAFNHHKQRSSQNAENSLKSGASKPTTEKSQETGSVDLYMQKLPTPELVIPPRRPAPNHNSNGQRPVETSFKDVTRKASAELGKMCEDAFNRSSVSYASELSQQGPVDSPATTVSAPCNLLSSKTALVDGSNLTPTLRDLMERRKKIIETWGEADPQTLAALVNTLDERITEEQRQVDAQRRVVSDPTNGRFTPADNTSTTLNTMQELKRYRGNELRTASDPLRGTDNTIRMVTSDPTSPISRFGTRPSKVMPLNSLKGGLLPSGFDQAHGTHDKRRFTGQALKPIMEDSPSSPKKQTFSDNRKWSWLGKKGTASNEDLAPTPPRKDTPKENKQRTISGLSGGSTESRKDESNTEETEARKRHWFQKVFGKRRHEHASSESDHMVIQDDLDDIETIDTAMTPAARGPTRRGHRTTLSMEGVAISSTTPRPEASQSWFAKFLRLKPATSVLVLGIGKVHARKEIVKILREWRKFGIRDVEVEKRSTGDVVRARVDAANCKCTTLTIVLTNTLQICTLDRYSSSQVCTQSSRKATKPSLQSSSSHKRKALPAAFTEL